MDCVKPTDSFTSQNQTLSLCHLHKQVTRSFDVWGCRFWPLTSQGRKKSHKAEWLNERDKMNRGRVHMSKYYRANYLTLTENVIFHAYNCDSKKLLLDKSQKSSGVNGPPTQTRFRSLTFHISFTTKRFEYAKIRKRPAAEPFKNSSFWKRTHVDSAKTQTFWKRVFVFRPYTIIRFENGWNGLKSKNCLNLLV